MALVDNDYSLLDASDLVFIDAPGTGFSRIAGKDKEKAFYGVDQDAHAFADFITQFLSKYGRWNSPKYLFGESYGTPALGGARQHSGDRRQHRLQRRHPALADPQLRPAARIEPQSNPGIDLPYELALPTYRGHRLVPPQAAGSQPADLRALPAARSSSSPWATTRTRSMQGASLPPSDQRNAIAEKLHDYTGLPVDYIEKANLRVNGGEFEKTLQDDAGPDHRPARHALLRSRRWIR